MEMPILTATTHSGTARSAAILRRSTAIFPRSQNSLSHFFPINTIKSRNNCEHTSCQRKCNLSVKVLLNLDLNHAAPSWLPRFEELDTTNMLLRQRIVFLGTQIDYATADFVISQLLLLDSKDQKKDIKLFINSSGGSVTAGMGIYDAMKLCKADVSTICMGLAASISAFLLASGTKGKRYCMPNARVMIHQPMGTSEGDLPDMQIRTRELSYHKSKMNKILSRITGKPEQQIELDTDRDNFMNPWEAKDYGLVDEVVDDGKPGLVAPIADASPLPEEKLLQKGCGSGQGDDGNRGTEHEEAAPTPL
ncbi:ATP-dependent Clp protease proteolytic subunit 3 [Orobanche hederae]